MRPGPALSAAVIAAVPMAALAVLAVSGAAQPGAVLITMVVVGAGALGLALLWHSDLDKLAETVRLAAAEDPQALAAAAAAPWLPQVETLTRDIERMARTAAARTLVAGQLRRADAAIVEKLPDPLIVLGPDRAIRRANAAARAAFGADAAAVLRHPGLRAAVERAFNRVGEPQTAELNVPVPVPREVHATVILLDAPLSDGGQAVLVLSDRTRERAAERTRADFVANASHELRTPLASLIGFIDTLRGPAADDPPAQQRFLGIMAEQAGRMNRLIDDLLSLSRIEMVEHQPPSGTVSLAALLPRIVAGFELRLPQRAQALELSIAPELPEVTGDSDQLAQVVQNLLDNALKYSRDKSTLRVAARPAPGGTRWPARPGVLLVVADEGAGIPRLHLPRLTERFYRVDQGRSRVVGGTGLGLAIVKHVVNRHRGQMAIESDEGIGTTVTIWLPQAPPRDQRPG